MPFKPNYNKKTGDSWVTPEMGRIFNKVAKRVDLDPSHVKEIFKMSWYNIDKTIREREWPQVCIEGFGKLKPSVKRMSKQVKSWKTILRNLREGGYEGGLKWRNTEEKLNKLVDATNRRCKELGYEYRVNNDIYSEVKQEEE